MVSFVLKPYLGNVNSGTNEDSSFTTKQSNLMRKNLTSIKEIFVISKLLLNVMPMMLVGDQP